MIIRMEWYLKALIPLDWFLAKRKYCVSQESGEFLYHMCNGIKRAFPVLVLPKVLDFKTILPPSVYQLFFTEYFKYGGPDMSFPFPIMFFVLAHYFNMPDYGLHDYMAVWLVCIVLT